MLGNVPGNDTKNVPPPSESEPHDSRPPRPRPRTGHPLHPRRRRRPRRHRRARPAGSSSIDGVKGLVCLGHAGEGTYLTAGGAGRRHPHHGRGLRRRCRSSPASPARATRSPAWRRSAPSTPAPPPAWSTPPTAGCGSATRTAPRRTGTRRSHEESGLPLILFQYPDATKATYNLDTQLEIAAQPGVFATKNGVRNMRRWDTEIPVLRDEYPDLQILTCHDEYLLHTMFDVDGAAGRLRRPGPRAADRAHRRRQGPGLRRGPRASTTGCCR